MSAVTCESRAGHAGGVRLKSVEKIARRALELSRSPTPRT
jgi:hypothetical protein